MAAKMTPEQFAETVARLVERKARKAVPSVRLGTVVAVDGDTAHVGIDGDSEPTPVARFCVANAGQRALVLKQGTQYYLIGAR